MTIEKGVDRKNIIEAVTAFWEDGKLARKSKEDVWDEVIQHYMVYVDEGKFTDWPWRCKVSRPVTQEVVDTISASVKTALFPDNEDFFAVEGLDEVGMIYEKAVENYLKTVLFKMRYVSNIEPFINQLCLIGNSHAALPWRKEGVVRRRWQDGVVVPWRQVTWDSTRLETHDMFDVVFDARNPFYEQNALRVRRKIISKLELKDRKNYSNLGKIEGGKIPTEASDSQREVRRTLYGMNEGKIDKTKDVELLIAQGDLTTKNKIYRDFMVVIADRKHLLMARENPYWCGNPNIYGNYSMFHNEMLGRGPAEPIKGLQKLIDTFSCQKADISNLIIGGMWAYVDDGLIKPTDVVSKPFGMIEVDNINNIRSLAPTANPTLAFNEIEDLRLEIERSSGASKFKQGVISPGKRTATEVATVAAGSDARFNDIVAHIGDMAIEPSLNMILQQEFQYNYRSPLLPEFAWEGMYKVNFHGARTSATRALAVQMLNQFTQILGQTPMLAEFINPQEFVKEWQKLLNIKNKKLVRTGEHGPLSREFPELGNGKGQPDNGRQPQGAQ